MIAVLAVDATNLIAVLNNLEDEGLIGRRRDRADRRRPIIELSPRGARLLADLDHAFREIDEDVLTTLTASERTSLNRLLAQAVKHISADLASTQRAGMNGRARETLAADENGGAYLAEPMSAALRDVEHSAPPCSRLGLAAPFRPKQQ